MKLTSLFPSYFLHKKPTKLHFVQKLPLTAKILLDNDPIIKTIKIAFCIFTFFIPVLVSFTLDITYLITKFLKNKTIEILYPKKESPFWSNKEQVLKILFVSIAALGLYAYGSSKPSENSPISPWALAKIAFTSLQNIKDISSNYPHFLQGLMGATLASTLGLGMYAYKSRSLSKSLEEEEAPKAAALPSSMKAALAVPPNPSPVEKQLIPAVSNGSPSPQAVLPKMAPPNPASFEELLIPVVSSGSTSPEVRSRSPSPSGSNGSTVPTPPIPSSSSEDLEGLLQHPRALSPKPTSEEPLSLILGNGSTPPEVRSRSPSPALSSNIPPLNRFTINESYFPPHTSPIPRSFSEDLEGPLQKVVIEHYKDKNSAIEEQKHSLAISHLQHTVEAALKKIGHKSIDDFLKTLDLSSSFNKHLKEMLTILKNSHHSPKIKSVSFISALREVIKTKDQDINRYYKNIILPVCKARFNGLNLSSYLTNLFSLFTKKNPIENEDLTFKNMVNLIRKANQSLFQPSDDLKINRLTLNAGKLLGAFGVAFDPHTDRNTPYVRSQITYENGGISRKVIHMRFGTVTKQSVTGQTETIEEFKGFLNAMENKRRNVGYFCLQAYSSNPSTFEREASRSNAIHALDATKQPSSFFQNLASSFVDIQNAYIHPNFFSFNLDFDSTMFQCLEPYLSMSDNEYKEAFLERLFNGKDKLRLSDKLNPEKEQIRRELSQLFDEVKNIYFKDQNLQNEKEKRQLLLFIFYAYFVEYFTVKLNLSCIVEACKDNKDRGGVMSALIELIQIIRKNKHTDPRILKEFLIHLFGPAIITKSEGIIEKNRLNLLTRFFQYINNPEISFLDDELELELESPERPSENSIISEIQKNPLSTPSFNAPSMEFEYMANHEDQPAFSPPSQIMQRLDYINALKRLLGLAPISEPIQVIKRNLILEQLKNRENRGLERKEDLNPEDIYKQILRDLHGGPHVNIQDKNFQNQFEISISTSENQPLPSEPIPLKMKDLLEKLGLPMNAKEVDLENPDHRFALKFLAFCHQGVTSTTTEYLSSTFDFPFASVGMDCIIAIKPFFENPKGDERRDFNKKTHALRLRAIFDKKKHIYRIHVEQRLHFKDTETNKTLLIPDTSLPFPYILAMTDIVFDQNGAKNEFGEITYRFEL